MFVEIVLQIIGLAPQKVAPGEHSAWLNEVGLPIILGSLTPALKHLGVSNQ